MFQEFFLALPTWIRQAKMREEDLDESPSAFSAKTHRERLKCPTSGPTSRSTRTRTRSRSSRRRTIERQRVLAACVVRELDVMQRGGRDKETGARTGVDPLPVGGGCTHRYKGHDADEATLFRLVLAMAKAWGIEGVLVLDARGRALLAHGVALRRLRRREAPRVRVPGGEAVGECSDGALRGMIKTKFQVRTKAAGAIRKFYNHHDATGSRSLGPTASGRTTRCT